MGRMLIFILIGYFIYLLVKKSSRGRSGRSRKKSKKRRFVTLFAGYMWRLMTPLSGGMTERGFISVPWPAWKSIRSR